MVYEISIIVNNVCKRDYESRAGSENRFVDDQNSFANSLMECYYLTFDPRLGSEQ